MGVLAEREFMKRNRLCPHCHAMVKRWDNQCPECNRALEAECMCKECAEPLEPEWGRCPACGAATGFACLNCSTALKSHWKVCPSCGKSVS